jgi:hypothetical protein
MCTYPLFNAIPLFPDTKSWNYIYLIRAYTLALLVPTVCFFCAFHWIDGVTDLLVILFAALTFCVRTDRGIFLFSVTCAIISFAMFNIWAIVRLLMFYTTPHSPAVTTERLAGWQADAFQAAVIMDVIFYTCLIVLCSMLYGSLKRISESVLPPPGPDDEDALFGGAFGGGGGSRRPSSAGYSQVSQNDPSYLQPQGTRAQQQQQQQQRQPYNFGNSQGYRLGGD